MPRSRRSTCIKNLHAMIPENTGDRNKCLACWKVYQDKWRKDNPGYWREYDRNNAARRNERAKGYRKAKGSSRIKADYLLWTYNLTPEKHEEILRSQCGVCVCGKPFDDRDHKPCVDHDHSCCPGDRSCGKCVRGILGRSCNLILVWIERDTFAVKQLMAYIGGKK